ncbi:hypothetical protein [Maribacter sp. Asnod2-G09]|uniref:hypothetical protein n=1 Tax=Maribacter sp. Asnod2-G09 TaxID=3160577 RepID=UPI00387009F1
MDLNKLKGEKKVSPILSLGTDSKNAELLLTLVSSEKGKLKQAAMKALANFDYEPATTLWQKAIKTKTKGEKIFIESTADSISEIIANEFFDFLSDLFNQPEGYSLTAKETADFKTFISLSLGKGSPKMHEIYRLAAKNNNKLATYTIEARESNLFINDYIRFFAPTAEDIKKIFPAILSMSILKSKDSRLIKLANDLQTEYAENWLSPVFMSALLTESSNSVFEKFSNQLNGTNATYLNDTLGALFFDKKIQKHVGLLFWGQLIYGEIDTRFTFSRPLFENLDERWFLQLTNEPASEVTLQVYNRNGVLYDSYDEMLLEILPQKIENKNIAQALGEYFVEKEKEHNGASTLYIDALHTLKQDVSEEVIKKHINCRDNAVSKYSLKPIINYYTNWSNERKIAFYKSISSKYVLKEEIAVLEK